MPLNCAAAPATPAPVPPSTSTQEGVERQIGDVLLAIVDLSGRALEEVHDGGRMRGDTKRQGGDLVDCTSGSNPCRSPILSPSCAGKAGSGCATAMAWL